MDMWLVIFGSRLASRLPLALMSIHLQQAAAQRMQGSKLLWGLHLPKVLRTYTDYFSTLATPVPRLANCAVAGFAQRETSANSKIRGDFKTPPILRLH